MSADAGNTLQLDVRPILAGGEEPFDLIMQHAVDIPDGGTLEIIAPFEPIPLYSVLAGHGFTSTTVEDDGAWVVRFTRVTIEPAMTVTDVHDRYPVTAPVFAKHGMDLCCGGRLSLNDVAAAHRVPLDTLIRELTGAVAGG